jgi:pilus assembly protein CpaB
MIYSFILEVFMESVNKKVILIAIVLSIFTSLLIYVYITNATAKPDAIDGVNVFVAARTLPAKYKITDSDIKQVKISGELLNSKAVTNKTDIIGKRLKESIIEGEQILRERLIDENNTLLSYNIPEGKRAVSINVGEQTAVSNLLRPGDFVDVVASFEKDENENAGGKTASPRITKIIIQNVEILSLGQEQVVTDEKLKEGPKTVSLAVNTLEVEKLIYASEYGILRLALRPSDDNDSINTQGAIREDIVPAKGTYTIPRQ